MFKLYVHNRNYTEWKVFNSTTLELVDKSFDPVSNKLFNQDIFSFDKEKGVTIAHSSTRSMKNIPGVLVLESERTYGKWKKRFLYKCIPDDKRLPIFLVPYTIKIGFSKRIYNKYVIFTFTNWEHKHPYGTLVQSIGDVTNLDHFYEYQLYCKSLYASIQDFTKTTMRALRTKSEDHYISDILHKYDIEDRRHYTVFSIDPNNSKDFDDAFSLTINDNITISIYISNVSFWLDIMNIWKSFSRRIATIYLPDRRRPMLPTILSDLLCSLKEGCTRFAFTLDITIDKDTGEILKTQYCNTAIRVFKNYRYDSKELEEFQIYQKLFSYVVKMNETMNYVPVMKDSHDMVAYLMIIMNYTSAKKLQSFRSGIFRSIKASKTFIPPSHASEHIRKFLKGWNSSGGKYAPFKTIERHDMLELEAYVHITSPIRRLVDLLNMIELQDKLGLFAKNNQSSLFYNEWTSEESFDYINTTMRAIRKVQNDCSLLNLCSTDKSLLDKIFDGFIFDRIIRNDGLYQYMVYLPEIKMVNRVTTRHEMVDNTYQKFKLYVFTDEHRLKHKLRLEIVIT
tara:strand:+ start:1324 stop:3018 length:1695 start_codon:yes stop_codon:yes gene_type:complete